MADYWKSQPRKFCQYCKCWIADNKPSVEFHERGKNHKENVAAKISEIKKKSIDKAKQDEKMSKQFAAMEEAAMKAYQDDLKRMEMEAGGLSPPAPTTAIPRKPPPQAKPQPKKQQKKQKQSKRFTEQNPAQVWVEGQSDDGHTYYYNTVTGESQWEAPEGFQGYCSTSAQPAQMKRPPAGTWMEAFSPEGFTYYYNTETGESIWEKPADFIVPPGTESNSERESQDEPSPPQPELPSGEEEKESSNGASTSQESEVPEQSSQQPSIPKISFRKRKTEAESSEKEGEDEKVSDDAAAKKDAEETKKEEEVPSTTAEPEKKKEEEVTQKVAPAKRRKAAAPYGVWEQIKEEKDPYANVDLQLPHVEGGTACAPAELPPEPKPKFKERIITSLGEEGGPTSFRKNKAQNGKSRSIRQRDNDD